MQIMNSGATMAALSELRKNDTTLGKELKKVASGMKVNDADMAKEMTAYTKANVLAQSAQAMLAQANQNASSVLSLLQ